MLTHVVKNRVCKNTKNNDRMVMIKMTFTAFKLGMGNKVWTKKVFFLQKILQFTR